MLNRGDRMVRFDLIEVTAWSGLTVHIKHPAVLDLDFLTNNIF
jgi:hypothetical protein